MLYCFENLKLSVGDVPFIDEIDFYDLIKSKELHVEIILVDHNNIFDESLEQECLVEIIDHHEQCKTFAEDVKVKIETVGSCSTLVMERIWEEDPIFKVKVIEYRHQRVLVAIKIRLSVNIVLSDHNLFINFRIVMY